MVTDWCFLIVTAEKENLDIFLYLMLYKILEKKWKIILTATVSVFSNDTWIFLDFFLFFFFAMTLLNTLALSFRELNSQHEIKYVTVFFVW